MDGSDNQGCGGSRGAEGSNPIGGTDDQNRDPQASMSSPTDDQKRNPQAVVSSPIDGTGDQNRDPHDAVVSSPIDGMDDQKRDSLTIGISSSSPIGSTEGQKREVDAAAVDSRDVSINVQVAHGLSLHDVSAPAQASFVLISTFEAKLILSLYYLASPFEAMLVFVANIRFFRVQNLLIVCFSLRAGRSYNGSELQYEQVHRIALLPCREICWTFRNLEVCSKRASGQPLYPPPPSGGIHEVGLMIGRRIASERDYHRFQIGGSAARDVKSLLVHDTGLEPQEQHLLFKGQEKQDYELLDDAGVQDKSKLLLVEDAAAREWRLQEHQKQEQGACACQAISHVHADVGKLEEQLSACEATAQSGAGCAERDLAGLSEMPVQELLKLDAVEEDGEAKNSRNAEVMRVLQVDDTVDRLRRENVKPLLTKNQPPTTATELPPSEIQTRPETKTLGNTEWENQPPTTGTELPPTESQTPPENEVVATTQWETLGLIL